MTRSPSVDSAGGASSEATDCSASEGSIIAKPLEPPFKIPLRYITGVFRWSAVEGEESDWDPDHCGRERRAMAHSGPDAHGLAVAHCATDVGHAIEDCGGDCGGHVAHHEDSCSHPEHIAYWRQCCVFHELFDIKGVTFVPYDLVSASLSAHPLPVVAPVYDIYVTMWPQRFFDDRKRILQAILAYMVPTPVIVESTFSVRNNKDKEVNRKKFFAKVRTHDIGLVLQTKSRVMFDLHGMWAIPPAAVEPVMAFANRLHALEQQQRHCMTCELPCFPLVIEARANRRCKGTCGETAAQPGCLCTQSPTAASPTCGNDEAC